jgi:ABC-type polysaccharide/polyol phosphate export permease
METRREPERMGAEPASKHAQDQAQEPAEDDLGPVPESQVAEEAATHHAIPRVRPRTTEELDREPPARQRYRTPVRVSLRELFASRELLLTFVERDLRVRYKQAVLGGIWAVLQPLTLMVIFTVVFGRIARIPHGGVPYPIFSYSALVPWGFFAGAIAYGTNAIVTNAPIIRKTYCPRELFPIASVASSGFDYLISLGILFGLLLAFGSPPQRTWVAFPLLLVILVLMITTLTLLVSAATVYFRDIRYATPMVLQVLLYATPIAYPLSQAKAALPPTLAAWYPYLNPLVPVMDGFRRILVFGQWPQWAPLSFAGIGSTVALAVTYWWYKRIDRSFADVI